MKEDSWCCVRPSGTEPKIKFYMGVKGSDAADANRKLNELKEAVLTLV
jgi:phosphoglucomutase